MVCGVTSVTGDTDFVHVSLGQVGTVGGLLGLFIVIAGVIGAAFRVSRNTQTVANYRESASAWEAKAAVQADEIKDLKEQVHELQVREAEKDTKIATMEEQISGLRDLLTQRATFEVLEGSLDEIRNGVRQLLQNGGHSP